MPSRYNLPHIDIGQLASGHEYIGQGSYGNPVARERAEHGRRLQGELESALAMADQARRSDARLKPPTGALIEVELRKGTDPEVLNRKREGIRAGAVKTALKEDRIIALYVPDHARPALAAILDEYLNGPVSKKLAIHPKALKWTRLKLFAWPGSKPCGRMMRMLYHVRATPKFGGDCGVTRMANARSRTFAHALTSA